MIESIPQHAQTKVWKEISGSFSFFSFFFIISTILYSLVVKGGNKDPGTWLDRVPDILSNEPA